MARRNDNLLVILTMLPWWVSVLMAAGVYFGLTVVMESVATSNPNVVVKRVLMALSQCAPYVALMFLLPAPFAALNARRKRRLLDQQTSIESIRALGWREFEELIGEAYRRKGYTVHENVGAGADGGIDLRLRKDGQLHLVQCKQWKAQKVGVGVVREMYGLITAESAARGIVICSGSFTPDAKEFAANKPVELIDGEGLAVLIAQARRSLRAQPTSVETAPTLASVMQCPQCGGELVLRTATRGANKGGRFYGCSAFPKCRHIQAAGERWVRIGKNSSGSTCICS